MKISALNPPTISGSSQQLFWLGLSGSSTTLTISTLAEKQPFPILIIASDQHRALETYEELKFFLKKTGVPLHYLPSWETLPYDHFSPHEELVSERLLTLFHMQKLKRGIVVSSISTLMHRLPPNHYISKNSFLLSSTERINLKEFRKNLLVSGYRHTAQVMTHGEFAIRGAILDLFPMGSKTPFRIELFDNEIKSIRSFNPETQLSLQKVNSISILAAHEFPYSQDSIIRFQSAWRAKFPGNPSDSFIYKSVSNKEIPQGFEYYLPLFFKNLDTIFDYLPKSSIIILLENTKKKAQDFWKEVNQRYTQQRYDTSRPILTPKECFLPDIEFFEKSKKFNVIKIENHVKKVENHVRCTYFLSSIPLKLRIHYHEEKPLKPIKDFIHQFDGRILFCAESMGRREILLDLLYKINLKPTIHSNWKDFIESDDYIAITVSNLQQGFILTKPLLALVTESQLFGEKYLQVHRKKQPELNPNRLIHSLTELDVGTPVVHLDHGIGRYQGLKHISSNNIDAEYLLIEYADADKIYVPVSSLHLISRYIGADSKNAPLQKLGTKKWKKIKEKANKQAKDFAAELLDIYGKRAAATGFSFPKPDYIFQSFRDAFPFEETPDQSKAIDEVIQDMTRTQPMDRLICGDVGFGKTEVAMQATFIATHFGKQVAILAPTTLLVAQHFEKFNDRFADWPIRIAVLSRLQTCREQVNTRASLRKGLVDVIIGTHQLLNPDIQFKDLGLLIIDEEQCFGVQQKERIKSLRANINILTLTATPIPRTLNMALAKIRDLSVIATPPARRLSIKTFIHEHNVDLIREAILRESLRGGQVYYLHNEVSTIERTARKLQEVVPNARIAIAHGQMSKRQLEKVMSGFYHQRYNVLLCTIIIESGIDVPTANTIIIDRADKFGLAQLHQLRGRVGRSHHQAYAYFLTPQKLMNSDADKRLEAISQLESLGSGFMLATRDLEIRGAGELLGEKQSGQINAIGFSLYMDLLETAVKSLQSNDCSESYDITNKVPELDIHETALIPENYVLNVHTRLMLYKKLSSCKSTHTIEEFNAEMIDRFGFMPEVTKTLFKLAHTKLKLAKFGIKKVDIGKRSGIITFEEKTNVDPIKIIALIEKNSEKYQLMGNDKLKFSVSTSNSSGKIEALETVLSQLI